VDRKHENTKTLTSLKASDNSGGNNLKAGVKTLKKGSLTSELLLAANALKIAADTSSVCKGLVSQSKEYSTPLNIPVWIRPGKTVVVRTLLL
jgi:hypothetical protein